MKFSSRKYVVISLVWCVLGGPVIAQDFTKHSIKNSLGVGAVSTKTVDDAFGLFYAIGYQKDINERLRINPGLALGRFSTRMTTDVPDVYFNNTHLYSKLSYDPVKTGPFSIVGNIGVLTGISKGLKGTGGEMNTSQRSVYFTDYNVGGSTGLGFRFNHSHKRTILHVLPINFENGTSRYYAYSFMVEYDFKL